MHWTEPRSLSDHLGRSSRPRGQLERMLENLDKCVADVMTETERCEQEEGGEWRLPEALQDELKRKERIQKALQELDKTDKEVVRP